MADPFRLGERALKGRSGPGSWCALLRGLLPQHHQVVVQTVTKDFDVGRRRQQVLIVNWLKTKREEAWAVDHVLQQGRPVGSCMQGGFDQPQNQSGIINGYGRARIVDSFFACFAETPQSTKERSTRRAALETVSRSPYCSRTRR